MQFGTHIDASTEHRAGPSGAARRCRTPLFGLPFAAACLVSIAALAGRPALAATAPPAIPGWDETLGLQAVVDDSVDALARIFDSPDYQQQLVVPGTGGQAVLLGLKDQSVKLLPAAAVGFNADEQATPDLARAQDAGRLTKMAGEVSFQLGDQEWTIRPAPPLVGPLSQAALVKAKPDYLSLAGKYTPDPGAVKTIARAADTRIVVFFGSWCHLCKKWVPHLLRTLEAANNPALTVEFFGVTEDHQEPKEPIAKYSISTTPTFIVIRGGKEIGRITETPDVSIEKDLALIMSAK